MKQKRMKRFIDRFHRSMERVIVRNEFLAKLGFFLNKKMTLNEFQMVLLPDESKVLCIGCGPFPWTLLILGKKRNWQFVGIDKDEEAVEHARKMVKYFDLMDRIAIENANGLSFDLSHFDLITIAFGVSPRQELLETISQSMKKGAQILYRTTWENLDNVYGKETIPTEFRIKGVFYRTDGIKSLLLAKSEKNK